LLLSGNLIAESECKDTAMGQPFPNKNSRTTIKTLQPTHNEQVAKYEI